MPSTAAPAPPRVRLLLARFSHTGLVFAALFYIIANTPSLLPRPWWMQGLVAALSGVCGYVLGLALGRLVHATARWLGLHVTMNPRRRVLLGRIGIAFAALIVISFPQATIDWQREVSRQVDVDGPGWWYPTGSTLVAVVVFVLFILVWRGLAGLTRFFLTKVSSRIVREAAARLVASVITVATVVVAIDVVVEPAVLAVVGGNADRVNQQMPRGEHAPTSSLRSGGPGSPLTWNSLGQDGAKFVAAGPDAKQIADVTKKPAKEPVRVFVGANQSLEKSADLAVAELDRTDAWKRKAMLVITPTSTGYVNLWGAASFEYLLGGDTAAVGMAYSNLPSAFGLLTAPRDPGKASQILLEKVRRRVDAMPAAQRPKVYFTGESLGAYGADDSFDSPQQMLERTDGGVLSGTPAFSPNRQRLTRERAPGSTTIDPVINGGRHIRFAGEPSQLGADEYDRPLGAWQKPRVVYLQHPSDPVVWWSPRLMFNSPEWLRETRDNTPMAQMSWAPFVTFWQVSADMLVSNEVPGGYGHRYFGAEMVPAWAKVLDVDPGSREDAIIDAVGRR